MQNSEEMDRYPPEILAQIAEEKPECWPWILAHPNCYPDLAQWILAQNPALAEHVTDEVPVEAPVTPPPTASTPRRKGLWLGIAAAVVAVVIIPVAIFATRQLGEAPTDAPAATVEPDSGEATVEPDNAEAEDLSTEGGPETSILASASWQDACIFSESEIDEHFAWAGTGVYEVSGGQGCDLLGCAIACDLDFGDPAERFSESSIVYGVTFGFNAYGDESPDLADSDLADTDFGLNRDADFETLCRNLSERATEGGASEGDSAPAVVCEQGEDYDILFYQLSGWVLTDDLQFTVDGSGNSASEEYRATMLTLTRLAAERGVGDRWF